MMLFTNTSFIGIDPTAGSKPFSYASLDHNLHLQALGQVEMDEVLAHAAGQPMAFVAVCAPRQPNLGLMEQAETRQRLSPAPKPGRWHNFRLCEYLLRQHRINSPQTPAAIERCPKWMRQGFMLYHRLENLGFNLEGTNRSERSVIEVYPHAAFTVLLGQAPYPKLTLEGRLQRQLALYERELDIPDPMHFFEEVTRYRLLKGQLPVDSPYSPGVLDALVAAFTAYMAFTHPDQVARLGDIHEGQIVLPVPILKTKY